MASMRAIFLLIVGLTLAVSSLGSSVHCSYEAINPTVQARLEALEGPRGSKDKSRLLVKPEEAWTAEAPVAKPWPEEFIVNFTTRSGAATGFMAYDWSQKRQVIYHGSDSTYCSGYGTNDACQMLEIPGGTYVYIPSLEQCFLSVADVGSLPPDWTTSSEYLGVEEVPGVGLCRSFAFPPTAHVWYETVVGSLPCLFVFPEPTMSYYFLPETFEVGAPDEKYFDFPDYCFTEGDAAIKKVVSNMPYRFDEKQR